MGKWRNINDELMSNTAQNVDTTLTIVCKDLLYHKQCTKFYNLHKSLVATQQVTRQHRFYCYLTE